MPRTAIQGNRKTRKSYTLSPESVAFLENVSRTRRSASISSVLDELIGDVRRAQEREALDKAVAGYYSGLAGDEANEQAEWGDLAFREFSTARKPR